MVKKLKALRYKEIFQELLPDTKGFINKETIYKSALPPEIKEILKPLLKELETYDEFLNFEDFYNAMEMLMKSISQAEKSVILQTKKKKTTTENFDFKPQTNTRRTSSSCSLRPNDGKRPIRNSLNF